MVRVAVNSDTIDNIELFVFDKDGTLIDLYTYWCNMIGLRAQGICSFYKLDVSEHKEKLMFDMGVDIRKKILRPEGPVGILPRAVVQKAAENYLTKLGCQDVFNICFRIFKEVDETSLSLLDKFIKPLDGAVELLKRIRQKGGKIAIATTDKTERAELAIKFLNIGNLIDLVVGADKIEQSKPAPDMLKLVGKTLGIDAIYSIMVGDAKTDIQMGINADFKGSIAVCSGITKKEELASLTPYVVDDIREIKIK
ncbi:MAG: HAD family hydrolase [Elusimicrobia bacterium]|nr:HAD family hydrolase [Elusimicrobiota bacterium]